MTFDAVGFGALNMDKLFKVNMIAKKEEEGSVLDFTECGGGSAANTTVGLAKLELKTGFIGKVASDREGKFLLNEFRKEGVDVNGITVSERGRSGSVMGFIDTKGDRALYVDPGVNDQIDFNDIDLSYFSGAKFLHLSSFVGEDSFKTQKQLLKQLTGINVSFDPGAIYARKGLDALKPIIRKCSVIFPNAIELKLLTGQDYKEGTQTLIAMGVDVVAVKLGKLGCFITDGKENHLIEPYKVKAVDTTGAGDAFCTGFLYGLIKQRNLFECGRLGNFVASRCISKMGARNGLPKLADLKSI
ncbi:MAG: carbohydrate kinase family protein [Candidatus Bathyarchaeia archaeon]|nr:carbohydrate kinase family protein [Candidatus Bathyarchaeia archaeon]